VTDWNEWRSPISGAPLHSDAAHSLSDGAQRWPVVEGIPFLRANRRDLAEAALHALDDGNSFEATILLLADQDDWARSPPPSEDARRHLVRQAESLSFRAAMDLLAFGPVATYFAHRWSDPTFLSGLALAEAHMGDGPVFELACGVGHYLREFARVSPKPAGADIVFAKLWLARRYIAPTATLVCFDAAEPWPVPDNAARTVFCHDAFYFLPNKPHIANEMRRVATGPILVGHAHNALTDNLSAGSPLSPTGYAALFGTPLLYDDRELTAALVDCRAPRSAAADQLANAPAISLAANAAPALPVAAGLAMPPQGARLRRNPLYGGMTIRWPSLRYQAEYAALATYPAEPTGPLDATAGQSCETDALARRRVLLDLPARW